ncbi:molybdate ABC transporter substrate-binding protein [Marimonas arenosa]|uniref:Molybdate ABC transporter substrate-binding protein n=1 Tax=Marimonas arenosa TaxID=1795305 RepID=A0AAE3WD91_9RHOB|nr:molybdate ABC transporter substrate-binding protein [Marimonas arenosa]MDQ2090579.1 molybdate ABC transporter substrate-binding protein [Marimonas arenosa]
MPFRVPHIACLLVAGFLSLTLTAAGRADQITVFAAASLKTALDDIARQFSETTGHEVTLSYAGSSVLARQITLRAPADIFISANPGWMDHLETARLIAPGTRADIVSNRLVLIAHGPGGAALAPEELPARLGQEYLAMALTDAVPAGIYGKAALTHLGLWEKVAPQVAQADNVRAALAYVALGQAPYGIVYKSDAIAEPRVSIVATFPEDSHPSIRYPAAAITGRDSAAAHALLAFLRGDIARGVLVQQGFTLLEKASP